jgi:hypothetical protein
VRLPHQRQHNQGDKLQGEAGYRHMTRRVFPRQMHTEQPTGKGKQGVQPQRCRNSFEDASPEELGKN